MKKFTQNVNKDKLFNDLPVVIPQKSKWGTRWANYMSCNVGDIQPIYVDEVLPNEKRKVTMAMTSHLTTPVAPIFNSLYTEIRAFFIPDRLCVDLLNGYKTRKSPWVKVFGEDNASDSSKIIVPLAEQKLPDFTTEHSFISDLAGVYDNISGLDSVYDSLDLLPSDYDANEYAGLCDFNFLTLAAYELIYQRHYRNENYETATESPLYQLLFDAYNPDKDSVSSDKLLAFTFEKANREKDYFTGIKPFTQKGDPVTVNIPGEAPVLAGTNTRKSGISINADAPDAIILGLAAEDANQYIQSDIEDSNTNVVDGRIDTGLGGSLYADLSSVKGISIEELRLLIKTQELLEKDAIYGSRYISSLNAHFGTCPLDLTLQDPQELYKTIITSQMQAIFQTSTTKDEDSILGTIGANSTTQTDPFVILPETTFHEHGILMICAVHKLQNVYDSSIFIPKFNFKKSRFDFYTPELNDLGYQPVTSKEMRVGASGTKGFNEAFAEYRYKFNKVHGRLKQEFPYWAPAIADEYETVASLYKEDPAILDKALSVLSDTAPQFYDAWGFEEENTKPMSLHSIPGMDGVI